MRSREFVRSRMNGLVIYDAIDGTGDFLKVKGPYVIQPDRASERGVPLLQGVHDSQKSTFQVSENEKEERKL